MLVDMKRFLAIWFPRLATDWYIIKQPLLKNTPFVLTAPDRGRIMVMAASEAAQVKGVYEDMPVADARAFIPSIQVFDYDPSLAVRLLKRLCEWCIRFTPTVAVDATGGLILDVSGCAHLWGGEETYVQEIKNRLFKFGFAVRFALADTIGLAWGVARYSKEKTIIKQGAGAEALSNLPPAALRLELPVVERLHKLGLTSIGSFMSMPRNALRRRFGKELLLRLAQALGEEEEMIEPMQPEEPYFERLHCLEPIATRTGIEIALHKLLERLCERLQKEGKGLRSATLKCYRVDGKVEQVAIGTHRASHHTDHLFKLFELKLSGIRPALGIELFTLDATHVEDAEVPQEALWKASGSIEDSEISELLDRVKGKIADITIRRFLPAEHYWPERSYRVAASLHEKPTTSWREDKLRPIVIYKHPEPIGVTAPIPDYPPMMFTHKGVLHKVVKADGPERIEREWWLDGSGLHRDYYSVEDEEGERYWIFRAGHYEAERRPRWFLHGRFS